MFLSYYYPAIIGKDYYKHKMANVAVWLSCYVYIFTILSYLTTVNQCLTIFFIQKLCIIGITSIRRSEKKPQTTEKKEM